MYKKVIGLEIDSNKLRAVELERRGAAIYLNKMASTPTPAGAVRDGELVDIDVMAKVIRKLLAQARMTARKVSISLSGKGVIIQEITLPSMPRGEMKEIIKGELERYPRLTTNNFIFDYQPLSEVTKKGFKKTRVFFVGISNRLLGSYLTCLRRAGLSVVSIDVAPLSAATSQSAALSEDEATAFVLIKDETTYITVAKRGSFRIFYSIEIGSKQLLRKMAQPGDTQPGDTQPGDAQPGDTQPGDAQPEDSQPGAKPDEPVLRELIREVERSFRFYNIEFGEGEVKRIILSFDSSILPQLDERMASCLGEEVKVEAADPLKQIGLSSQLHVEEGVKASAGTFADEEVKGNAGAFAVAIGAALRGLKKIGHRISLELLQTYIPRPGELKKRAALVIIFCLLVGLATWEMVGRQQVHYNELRSSLRDKKAQLSSLDSRLAELKSLTTRHRNLRECLKQQASYLEKLNGVSWSVVLSKVTQMIPEDVWLSLFKSTDKGKLTLEGATFSVDQVASFTKQMDQDTTFEYVNLGFVKRQRLGKAAGVKFRLESALSSKKEKDDANTKTEDEN